MKAFELRELTLPELLHRQRELEEEHFNLRMQNGISPINNPNRLKQVRREIARIQTILHEYDLGISSLKSEDQANLT